MTVKIDTKTFKQGAEELARRDKDFKRLYETIGLPCLRSRATGYGSILKIINAQQVSVAAAKAINGRLDAIEKPMRPETFLTLTEKQFKEIGLSRQKAAYGRSIAEAVVDEGFSFRRVARMNDEDAITALSSLKGVGQWTAEVYLLFALRRPDLWPVDDLGVIKGLTHLKELAQRPNRDQMLAIGKAWRPWRSVAARLLWHHIGSVESNKKK